MYISVNIRSILKRIDYQCARLDDLLIDYINQRDAAKAVRDTDAKKWIKKKTILFVFKPDMVNYCLQFPTPDVQAYYERMCHKVRNFELHYEFLKDTKEFLNSLDGTRDYVFLDKDEYEKIMTDNLLEQ